MIKLLAVFLLFPILLNAQSTHSTFGKSTKMYIVNGKLPYIDIFTAIPLSELLQHIEVMLDKILLQVINAKQPVESETLMTVEEVSRFLKVSKATIHTWKIQRRIKFYRIGRRVYFKQSEILSFK